MSKVTPEEAEAKVREIFDSEFEDLSMRLDLPGIQLYRLSSTPQVQAFREEISEGRFTEEDLKNVLDRLFSKAQPGVRLEDEEIVCGILIGISGSSIEGVVLSSLAGIRAAEIGRCCRLARAILKKKIES